MYSREQRGRPGTLNQGLARNARSSPGTTSGSGLTKEQCQLGSVINLGGIITRECLYLGGIITRERLADTGAATEAVNEAVRSVCKGTNGINGINGVALTGEYLYEGTCQPREYLYQEYLYQEYLGVLVLVPNSKHSL